MAKPPRDKGKAEVAKKAVALGRLEVKYVAISAISANSYNPNRQSEAEFGLLIKSITEDGFTQPIVVVDDKDNPGKYVIVDGEHRFRAAAQIGYAEIPVAVAPMSLEQARIATLRHNRARGSEDIELATQVLRDLQALGALDWAQDSLGLSDVEINRLLDDIPAPEALAGAEFTPAWTPTTATVTETTPGQLAGTATAQVGENAVMSQSWAAADALREREVRIAGAKSDQEREQIKRDTAVYRISCIYAGAEADLVKAVLGADPAVRLLALCQGAQAAAGAAVPADAPAAA